MRRLVATLARRDDGADALRAVDLDQLQIEDEQLLNPEPLAPRPGVRAEAGGGAGAVRRRRGRAARGGPGPAAGRGRAAAKS